jgi:hypothetical protein
MRKALDYTITIILLAIIPLIATNKNDWIFL